MLLKCYVQYVSKFGKFISGYSTEKVSFHSNPEEGQCQRMFNYYAVALISHASKVILTILQARLQMYMNQEFPKVQTGFQRGRGTRNQIANIHTHWIMKESKEFHKNIYFCFVDYTKAFDYVYHNKLWKIIKEMGIETILPSWETCMQVKKQ